MDKLTWCRIKLSDTLEGFFSAPKPNGYVAVMSPQVLRQDNEQVIYLKEHSNRESAGIYLIDFTRDTIKEIFQYNYDDDLDQYYGADYHIQTTTSCYLSGNNFVAHTEQDNWCLIQVWNLNSILSGTRQEQPSISDFAFEVDKDRSDLDVAMVSDSGIIMRCPLTRRREPTLRQPTLVPTHNFDYYHDFIREWPSTSKCPGFFYIGQQWDGDRPNFNLP